jgi:malonyl CoA-acyl carrier protein transacylase
MTLIYLFPGQGSQKTGMGQDLFARFPHQVEEANDILGYSIAKLCLEDPANQLNLTQYTQPALYTVNALSFLAQLEEGEPMPAYLAGHSLGEYNALFAAQAFDFATGLKLVQKRGEIMGRAKEGSMSAVIGLSLEEIQQVFQTLNVDTVDIANLNSPTQIVISGPPHDLDQIDPACKKTGAKLVVRLNVSGAFHSRYMRAASVEFSAFLQNFTFAPLKIPVIANVSAQPYIDQKIADYLAAQIFSPVRWTQTIEYLLKTPAPEFKELGPAGVLTKLVKQISIC